VSVEDFRGIAISLVTSKVFEHCILDCFKPILITNSNVFVNAPYFDGLTHQVKGADGLRFRSSRCLFVCVVFIGTSEQKANSAKKTGTNYCVCTALSGI